MAARRPLLIVSAAVLMAFGVAHAAMSAAARKPHRAQPIPASRDVDPVTTATIPAPRAADPDAAARSADNEPLPPPFRLPSASRARMRDCGLRWQVMKMSGEAGDDIWRDFAVRCLAAADGPFETHPSR